MNATNCSCQEPPFDFQDYNSSYLGVDSTNGRYADVTVEECKHCKTKWLRYLVEFESISGSGRWYKGIISDEDVLKITPENAIEYIEKLDWYFYGGSYFSSTGKRGKGKASVDC